MIDSPLFAIPVLMLVLLILGIIFAASHLMNRRLRIAERALSVGRIAGGRTPEQTAKRERPRDRLLRTLARLGADLPLFNAAQRRVIVNKLMAAGLRHPQMLSAFVALKLASGAAGCAADLLAARTLAVDSPIMVALMLLVGLQGGLMLPEMALNRIVQRRRSAIHRALPDALDLLVICTNAGFSLVASVHRVAEELVTICPPLAFELETTGHEMNLSADPSTALRNLAERTGVESLRSLVATLIQSHRYGTPITQSLKTLARTERNTRMLTLEERAAKLTTRITIPMMLLILPAVVFITAGPAFLNFARGLK